MNTYEETVARMKQVQRDIEDGTHVHEPRIKFGLWECGTCFVGLDDISTSETV